MLILFPTPKNNSKREKGPAEQENAKRASGLGHRANDLGTMIPSVYVAYVTAAALLLGASYFLKKASTEADMAGMQATLAADAVAQVSEPQKPGVSMITTLPALENN